MTWNTNPKNIGQTYDLDTEELKNYRGCGYATLRIDANDRVLEIVYWVAEDDADFPGFSKQDLPVAGPGERLATGTLSCFQFCPSNPRSETETEKVGS